jgi:hypothetical protein
MLKSSSREYILDENPGRNPMLLKNMSENKQRLSKMLFIIKCPQCIMHEGHFYLRITEPSQYFS